MLDDQIFIFQHAWARWMLNISMLMLNANYSARCKKTSARWRTIVLDGGLWLLYQYFAKNAKMRNFQNNSRSRFRTSSAAGLDLEL